MRVGQASRLTPGVSTPVSVGTANPERASHHRRKLDSCLFVGVVVVSTLVNEYTHLFSDSCLIWSAGIPAGANLFHTTQPNCKQHAGRDAGAPRR